MDRRSTCRYPAKMKAAVLGWDEGGSRIELPVVLENISMQSCLVKSPLGPAAKPGQPVWFKAPDVDSAKWIKGVLVSAVKPFLREYAIRIRFLEPLPFQTFKLLVYGPEEVDLDLKDRPAYETDQFWR